jgi:3-methyl-2-oxobutanoate hydroxymethyltransferase
MILPFSKTIIQRLTTPFPPTPPPIDQLPFCSYNAPSVIELLQDDAYRLYPPGLRRGTGGHCESHTYRRTSGSRKITTATHPRKEVSREPITCLTAYDYATARLVDEAGIDIALVGDSLAMTMLGYENTLSVTVDEMLHHVKAVRRGVKDALLIADMPYGSYQVDPSEAIHNAARFVKEGGAEAVKMEGGEKRVDVIRRVIDAEIPVAGHIGLTPQSVNVMGGYKVQGKTLNAIEQLMRDAVALDRAGSVLHLSGRHSARSGGDDHG